jgi:hypothetical protein
MKKIFKPVPGPFAIGNDERATQDTFVEFVGGRTRAERLQDICHNSYPTPFPPGDPYAKTRHEVFRMKAKREGFTDAEIDAFLML